jgi:hypothetical protein
MEAIRLQEVGDMPFAWMGALGARHAGREAEPGQRGCVGVELFRRDEIGIARNAVDQVNGLLVRA